MTFLSAAHLFQDHLSYQKGQKNPFTFVAALIAFNLLQAKVMRGIEGSLLTVMSHTW